jgi:hypothetical protein
VLPYVIFAPHHRLLPLTNHETTVSDQQGR